MRSAGRLSLADLVSRAIISRPEDASALVRRLCLRAADLGVTPPDRTDGPLRAQHVSLDAHGGLHIAPGVWPTVVDLGVLLEQLLTAIRDRGSVRIPPGLLLATARATGKIDSAPLPSTISFARALERFDPPDPDAALRALFEAGTTPEFADEAPAADVPIRPSQIGTDSPGRPAPAVSRPPTSRPVLSLVQTAALPRAGKRAVARGRRSRIAAALVAASAFAGGIAVAVVLQPKEPVRRPTDSTEVTIATSGRAGKNPRPAPTASAPRPSSGERGSTPGDQAPERKPAPSASAAPFTAGSSSAPERLIDPKAAGAEAAFSPSFDAHGTAVFFHADTANGSALKRAERDESGELHVVTIIDDQAKNYHVQVSPDGQSVAFDSDRDGVRGVYVARADGSNVRRVSGPGYAAVPTWSPDGRRLAYLRAESGNDRVWNLWLLDLSSRATTRLTNHATGQVWSAAWFPNGERIAYSHEDRLVLLDLDSRRATSYASPRQGQLVRTPAVSPDGQWIMFQVYRDGGWLLDLTSGSMQRVLDDPTAEEFTWSPDGRRVAFHSRRSGGWSLWMMSPR